MKFDFAKSPYLEYSYHIKENGEIVAYVYGLNSETKGKLLTRVKRLVNLLNEGAKNETE